MKFKALRTKREPQEFVEICFHRHDEDPNRGTWIVYTGELPNPQPESATKELMEIYYSQQAVPLPEEINLDDYELVELDCIESGVVGADIRNKLTPPLNLISLLRIYFTKSDNEEDDVIHREKILPYIRKEMIKSEENIKYISNLL